MKHVGLVRAMHCGSEDAVYVDRKLLYTIEPDSIYNFSQLQRFAQALGAEVEILFHADMRRRKYPKTWAAMKKMVEKEAAE